MGKLNGITGTTTYSNFYHKFKGNGVDRIDFIGTEQHPRNYNNGVYHGYIKDGNSYDSNGVKIDPINDDVAPSVQAFTRIFTPDPCQLIYITRGGLMSWSWIKTVIRFVCIRPATAHRRGVTAAARPPPAPTTTVSSTHVLTGQRGLPQSYARWERGFIPLSRITSAWAVYILTTQT